jgi:Tir chaperone protein (CesT) family
MLIKEFLDSLVDDFGNRLGLPDLSLDSNGLCQLKFGDSLCLMIERHEGDVFIYCVLRTRAELSEHGDDVLRPLLEALFFSKCPGGVTAAIDPEEGDLVLYSKEKISRLDADAFDAWITEFVLFVEKTESGLR